jgi:mono/diheme cytochrome c family protein
MKKTLAVVALTAFALTATADDAAALYKSKCAMCHGPAGAGDTAMGKKLALKPLASAEVQKNTDAKLLEVITKGRGKMPMFGGKLTDAQIKQLVAVVRGFAKK